MTEKSPAPGENVAKTYEKTSSMPKSQQVDLLAQALLREFMHRHGYLETLRTFDEECARNSDTISSRAVMRQLLNIPVQGRPSRLVAAAPRAAEKSKAKGKGASQFSLMEELCSYRLAKREYRVRRSKAAGDFLGTPGADPESGSGSDPNSTRRSSPSPNKAEEDDPSDTEVNDLRSKSVEHEAAIAQAEAQLEKGQRLQKIYEAKKKEKKLKQKVQKDRRKKNKEHKNKDESGSEEEEGYDSDDDHEDDMHEGKMGKETSRNSFNFTRGRNRDSSLSDSPAPALSSTKSHASRHSDGISSFSDTNQGPSGATRHPSGALERNEDEKAKSKKKKRSYLDTPGTNAEGSEVGRKGGREELYKIGEEEHRGRGTFPMDEPSRMQHTHPWPDLSSASSRKQHHDHHRKGSMERDSRSSSCSSDSSTSSWPVPIFGQSLRQKLLEDLEPFSTPSTEEVVKKAEEKGTNDTRETKNKVQEGVRGGAPLTSTSYPPSSGSSAQDRSPSSSFTSLSPSVAFQAKVPSSSHPPTPSTPDGSSPIHSPLQRPAASGHPANPLPKFGLGEGANVVKRKPTPPRPVRRVGAPPTAGLSSSVNNLSGGGSNRFYKGAGYNSNLSISLNSSPATSFITLGVGSGGPELDNNNEEDDKDTDMTSNGTYRYDRTAKPLQSALVSSSPTSGKWRGSAVGGSGSENTSEMSRGSGAEGPGKRGFEGGVQSTPPSSLSPGIPFSTTPQLFSSGNTSTGTSLQSFGGFSAPTFTQTTHFASSPLSTSIESGFNTSSNTISGKASPDKAKRKDRKVTIIEI